jgi:putative effector of murein hydrolase
LEVNVFLWHVFVTMMFCLTIVTLKLALPWTETFKTMSQSIHFLLSCYVFQFTLSLYENLTEMSSAKLKMILLISTRDLEEFIDSYLGWEYFICVKLCYIKVIISIG